MPGISILFSSVFGYLTRDDMDLAISGLALIMLISLTFIGSLDIYSGILGAFSFIAVRLWLLPDFSVSSIALTIVCSFVFFLPSLISSFFNVLAIKANSSGAFQALNAAIFQWIFPLIFLHSGFLVQRSINGSTQSTLAIEALLAAATLSGRQIQTFLSNTGLKWRKRVRMVEEFELNLGRLISPSFVFSILSLFLVIFYSWTFSFSTSISLALIVASPLFLLIIRPTWQGLRFLSKLKRNHIVEILIVSTLSVASFMGVQYLPLVPGTSALQTILLGLLPVFLHALISFAADLSEKENKEVVL
jgi:hypothetical protein